ncbi:hypothetical protein ES705_31033 [subsurface metagenome]
MKRTVIGIMGSGENATQENKNLAYEIGKIVAKLGYIVLTGGRNCGVMEAAMKGAKDYNGTTVGIIPDDHTSRMSEFVDIPIITGMGSARNNINVLSSDLIIAIGTSPGTISEVALAIKANKKILIPDNSKETIELLKRYKKSYVSQFNPYDPMEIEKLIVKYT